MLKVEIRDAQESDIGSITSIYEQAVILGTGSFEIDPPDDEEMLRRFRKIKSWSGVYIVACLENDVVGYAYAGPYRSRAAYFNTAEDSIYVHPKCQGDGVGFQLLNVLLDRTQKKGFRQMIAVIGDSDNHSSIELHKKCGFQQAGLLKAVGYKFNRWIDSVLMQKTLSPGSKSVPTRGEEPS